MLRQFKLPDVGEGLTEGEILQWLVAVGDTVTVNQPLCEVETAKAAVELPSPYAGTVTELLFEAGTMVDVGTPIITIDTGATPDPLFAARVVRGGDDVTVLAYGPMVKTALQAAEAAAEEGRSLEVVDLRTLSPLDLDPVIESVRRTGRCVVVHEAPVTLGLGAEIAARVTETCFHSLEAPVLRVGGYDTPYPPSKLEEDYLPDLDRVLDAVDRAMEF